MGGSPLQEEHNVTTLEVMATRRASFGLPSKLGIVAACLVTTAMAGPGCQSLKKMTAVVGDLRAVQSEVAKATGHDEVTVNLSNGRFLAVGLVNSPSAEWPKERRQSQARQIAQLAYDKVHSRLSLDTVFVSYVVHRKYVFFFDYTNSLDTFTFKASDLEQSKPEGTAKGSPP